MESLHQKQVFARRDLYVLVHDVTDKMKCAFIEDLFMLFSTGLRCAISVQLSTYGFKTFHRLGK